MSTQVRLIRLEDGGSHVELRLTGEISEQDKLSFFKVAGVTLDLDIKTVQKSAEFVLSAQSAARFSIPMDLLEEKEGFLVIKPWAELKDEADEAKRTLLETARRNLRQLLAEPLQLEIDDKGEVKGPNFLGLRNAASYKWSASVRVLPDILDGPDAIAKDEIVLQADARAGINVTANGAAIGAASAVLSLVVRKSDLTALAKSVACALRIEDGFSLPLPEFELPEISIGSPNWSLDWAIPTWVPSFNGFSFLPIGLPGAADWETSIDWNGNDPKLTVDVADGEFSAVLSASDKAKTFEGLVKGRFSGAAVEIGKITALSASFAKDTQFQYAVAIEAGQKFSLPNRRIDLETLPFVFDLQDVTITPAVKFATDSGSGGNFQAETTIEIGRLLVIARDNPAIFIAFAAQVVTTMSQDGHLKTKVTSLRIVEPYSIELVKSAADVVGRLLRIVTAIPLPGAPGVDLNGIWSVIRRLAELLGAAARWLARQAGQAAGLLAGLAEAIGEALISIVNALAELAKKLMDKADMVLTHISVEIRLDADTYQIRQIVIAPATTKGLALPLDPPLQVSALGFDLTASLALRPSLFFDFGPEKWFGLVVQPDDKSFVKLGTDLWLEKVSGPPQATGTAGTETAPPRLVEIEARPAKPAQEIVVVALRRGKLELFQALSGQKGDVIQLDNNLEVTSIGASGGALGKLPLDVGYYKKNDDGSFGDPFYEPDDPDLKVGLGLEKEKLDKLRKRLLALLPKVEQGSASGGGLLDKLKQKIQIDDVTYGFSGGAKAPVLSATFGVIVQLEKDFAPSTKLGVNVSLRDLSMKITGGDRISVYGTAGDKKTYHPLGLDLVIDDDPEEKIKDGDPYEQFYIDLSNGGETFGLGKQAKAELSFGAVSNSGKGLQFEITEFTAGRGGFDFDAKVKPDPVNLGGVDVPFRFTSGHLSIKGSRFGGASLIGSGQLPQNLVGEANASIALQLGADSNGSIVVESATARLDKSGDPIKCNAIRFELTITELGFNFVREGSYHFYFELTGSAVFKPADGEFASGMLKSFKDVEIRLNKAPLANDPRVLMRSISFHVKVDPPKRTNFFSLFDFELRGVGFYPSAEAFGGDPALAISGQVKFIEGGDMISPRIDFHNMWIAPPGENRVLPRIRFDGLTVGLNKGPLKIEATAIAVDGSLPKDLFRPDILPANVTAEGFLAGGRMELSGWAPMSAKMGFLELRDKTGSSKPKHSFFVYGQFEKQTVPIPTPIGEIYLREYGFGFGYRYTLAGIAQAEMAQSPRQLVKILDEVSKYQGNLDSFEAWEPTYSNDDLTLALRGMFSVARSPKSQDNVYDEEGEAELPNPVLFDIVAALRTDLTFMINLRGWISVNYNDWAKAGKGEDWKSKPTMRGYLYLSVPRKEFLGRFIADGQGHIGTHPRLPPALETAIKASQFSATLYIRPGLFHFELGWPYELKFTLGEPNGQFYLSLSGGMIQRIEDNSLLTGIAFKAIGKVHLEGRIGSDSFGAAAVAHADFALEARVISYLSLRRFGDSFYYGFFRFDATLGIRVEAWISFRVFGHRIRIAVGFSLHLSVSVALEGVITGEGRLGGRAFASIGISAFGRSLSLGIGFAFNDGELEKARARVVRFMTLGLGTDIPDKALDGQKVETNPKPQRPADETSANGDNAVDQDLGKTPAPVEQPKEDEVVSLHGDPIVQTDFWAFLFPIGKTKGSDSERYVMQLIPRDHTFIGVEGIDSDKPRSTFYAGPGSSADTATVWHKLVAPEAAGEIKRLFVGAAGNSPSLAPVKIGATAETADALGLAVDVVVGRDDLQGVDFKFKSYLLSQFLLRWSGSPEIAVATEPKPRLSKKLDTRLPADSDAAALELSRAGRSRVNLTIQQKREAEIAEARSAAVAAVCESAAQIAATLGQYENGPPRFGNIDARDFGLTFVVSAEELQALFDDLDDDDIRPPAAKFCVIKSDAFKAGEKDCDVAGRVHLFNHPDRMFRKAQPNFSPTHEITTEGIKLDWDLEPAWGDSLGAYHDPEFHLKHYRIRRYIRGLGENEYRAEFTVKAGSPERLSQEPDGSVRLERVRPPYQFIDDLLSRGENGQGAIPDAIRDVLLGKATNLVDWKKANGGDVASVNIVYEITPIDIAGTSDSGEPYVVRDFRAPEVLPVSPREAALQIAYDGILSAGFAADGSPTFPTKSTVPGLRFLMTAGVRASEPADATGATIPVIPEPDSKTDALQLRILEERAIPSGSFGSDALDEARTRLDEAAIEKLAGQKGVSSFILKRVTDTSNAIMAEFEYLKLQGTENSNIPNDQKYGRQSVSFKVFKLKEGKEEASSPEELRKALGATGSNNAGDAPGLVRRAYLRAESRTKTDVKAGEWRSVSFNIVLKNWRIEQKSGSTPQGLLEEGVSVNTRIEAFEQPVNLALKPLTRTDFTGESGNIHLYYPRAGSSLDDLLRHRGLNLMADSEGRTGVRLRWNARPRDLQIVGDAAGAVAPDLFRWIGGYEIHAVDPDTYVNDGKDEAAALAAQALPVGKLKLSPPSLRGLEPPEFGDLSRIEAYYPSDALRIARASRLNGAKSTSKAAWFSSAESTAIFPELCIRRSIMPEPDDADLALLFAGGTPDQLRISFPDWADEKSDPLPDWLPRLMVKDVLVKEGSNKKEVFVVPLGKSVLNAGRVRAIMRALQLQPKAKALDAARASEQVVLAQRLKESKYLGAVKVRIEAVRAKVSADGKPLMQDGSVVYTPTASIMHDFDILPRLHPVLADALSFVQFGERVTGDETSLFKRYSIVSDPDPKVDAKSFEEYVAASPPQKDKNGWGALRLLGLATGFRLYDKLRGNYAPRDEALKAIHGAMRQALNVYAGRDCGQAFVDVVTRPWGNSKLFWFDGGIRNPSKDEVAGLIGNEALSVMQIALRPRPDRSDIWPQPDVSDDARLAVRYAIVRAMAPGPEKRLKAANFTIELRTEDDAGNPIDIAGNGALIDVLPVHSGIASVHPVRLSAEARKLIIAGNYLMKPREPVAVLRVIVRNSEFDPKADLAKIVKLSVEAVEKDLTPPTLEADWVGGNLPNALKGGKETTEHAFGKFAELTDADWAEALFRPTLVDNVVQLNHVEAVSRFAAYIGMRFGSLAVPVGNVMDNSEEPGAIEARKLLAGCITRFWTPFLQHCWVPGLPSTESDANEPQVYFSLGTVADPGTWQQAPDASGRLSILIPQTDRGGKRYKFAVRPVGRYAEWAEASPWMLVGDKTLERQKISGLAGALSPGDALGRFKDITIPRSEPLEKPVVLLSRRTMPPGPGRSGGRFELVIAHSTDMVLAQANRRNDAVLAPQELAVGFWREFPHLGWLNAIEALEEEHKFKADPGGEFGELDPKLVNAKLLALDRDEARKMLEDLRPFVPDAWLGSTAISALLPPYFFRTHALVHMAAGIVVSEQSAAVNEQGYFELRWAEDGTSGDLRRTMAKNGPQYSVSRKLLSEDGGVPCFKTLITIDLAAMRFIDCMASNDAAVWFPGSPAECFGEIGNLVHLPEPAVNYRISLEAIKSNGEVIQRVPEIDVLPAPPPATKAKKEDVSLYLLQKSGSRLEPMSGNVNPSLTADGTHEWRIRPTMTLLPKASTGNQPSAQAAYQPVIHESADPEIQAAMLAALKKPALDGVSGEEAIAGLAPVTLTFSGTSLPTQGWEDLEDYLTLYQAHEARETVQNWKRRWTGDPSATPPVPAELPPDGTVLTVWLNRSAIDVDELKKALWEITGSHANKPSVGAISRLILRAPPNEAELLAFHDTELPKTQELEAKVHEIAEEQLFGKGRKLSVMAMMGDRTPLSRMIERSRGDAS
ncbi:hypothetical protein IHQ71_22860 [Rhizobium sp. TH2]|uniref:hypothetical protein n=1 Tax=Rhizobium sp. TH2 TaxID=2775403 RepID=UPI002158477E|nr:hypothetical protein [Rhizobium sp. TH2]UVC07984.1 hypothetical protein IHQ71_22860 [Rhizobium sp. TH2]